MGSKTLYTQEARRLSPQTVFSAILQGGKTFEEMAPEYGLTTEQFEDLVLTKVGEKEFARLKKASTRNQSNKPKKKAVGAPSEQTNKPSEMTEEAEKETITMSMSSEISKLNASLVDVEREIGTLSVIIGGKKSIFDAEKEKLSKAKANKRKAETALEKAKERYNAAKTASDKAEAELASSQKELENWQERKSAIEQQITELQKRQIYLVAPGYHGEMPKVGTFVAVTQIEGTTLEDVKDVELVKELSAQDIFLFDSMQEAKEAYNYVRLVMKYYFGDKEYKLLVDNESIIILLKKQEVYQS